MMKPRDERNRLNSVEVWTCSLAESIAAYLIVGSVFAQKCGRLAESKLLSVRYAPLAELARIQGDVRLKLDDGLIAVVSGHPLLASMAAASVKELGPDESQTNLDLTYHFILVDTVKSVPTVTTVKRGNAFKRAILRVLGLKTEKVVHGYRCKEGEAPASEVKVNGGAIEVWIYGRTHCIQTNTATLVAGG